MVSVFVFPSNQQHLVYMKKSKFLWSGSATWCIIISLGSTPSLYQVVDDDGFLEEHGHRIEARSFHWRISFHATANDWKDWGAFFLWRG
ncbi:predicted protein [Lichtheimia corymbifera JMRC:FSU:9682]|uniref:Uncharacterized protein n=1 Tax=Lichtheimia corymbifera JMRC:FSU:9682 TaxID=1263082 RepID=A0A068RUW9_9FUNG|nr:predicted protein [Lichtheimia corymbifera JMRC:FSU:9682]